MSLSPLSTRETPPSVPRPVSPAHLLCISLLPCRKKHNSFVVYPSQSGSESGGMFPVSCGSQTERTRGHVATHVFFYAKSVMTWRREKNTSPPCLSLSSTDTCRLRAVTHPPASVVIHGSHRQERSALGGSDWQPVWLLLGNKCRVSSTGLPVPHQQGTQATLMFFNKSSHTIKLVRYFSRYYSCLWRNLFSCGCCAGVGRVSQLVLLTIYLYLKCHENVFKGVLFLSNQQLRPKDMNSNISN